MCTFVLCSWYTTDVLDYIPPQKAMAIKKTNFGDYENCSALGAFPIVFRLCLPVFAKLILLKTFVSHALRAVYELNKY